MQAAAAAGGGGGGGSAPMLSSSSTSPASAATSTTGYGGMDVAAAAVGGAAAGGGGGGEDAGRRRRRGNQAQPRQPKRKVPPRGLPAPEEDDDMPFCERVVKHELLQWLFLAFVVGLMVYFLVDALTTQVALDQVETILEWVENRPTYIFTFVFLGVYSFAIVVGIPMTVVTLAGGYVYAEMLGMLLGVTAATLVACLANVIGGLISLGLARTILFNCAHRYFRKSELLSKLNMGIRRGPFKINVLLRFSPVVPYQVINYGMGCTDCPVIEFALAAFIGSIPYAVFISYVGALLGSMSEVRNGLNLKLWQWLTVIFVSVLLLLGVTYLIHMYTQEAISLAVEEQEALLAEERERNGEHGEDELDENGRPKPSRYYQGDNASETSTSHSVAASDSQSELAEP